MPVTRLPLKPTIRTLESAVKRAGELSPQLQSTIVSRANNLTLNNYKFQSLQDLLQPLTIPAQVAIRDKIKKVERELVPLLARRETLKKTSSSASARQATAEANGQPIPILYGRTRIGPMLSAKAELNGDLVIRLIWCIGGEGPGIDAIESIKMDGEDVPAGVTLTHYLGTTSQVADATLSSAITGYSDTLVTSAGQYGYSMGIAYTVARVPQGASSGFPRFEAIIRGLKVYDPRRDPSHPSYGGTGSQALGTPSTWEYSNNPSLCLADFLRSGIYGRGKTIDWASVATAADTNDELLGDGSKRREIGLAVINSLNAEDMVSALQEYAGAWVIIEGDSAKLVPNRPVVAGSEITISDMVDESFRLRKTGLRDVPTVMRVIYTNTQSEPWRDAEAVVYADGVLAGTIPYRESEIRLDGITRFAQADRVAKERLNALTLSDLQAEWAQFDSALTMQIGDVHPITHPRGLTQKLMRIMDIRIDAPDRYRITAHEYDPAVYNDSVESEPTFSDTSLSNPLNPPAVTDLALNEELFTDEAGRTFSRIRATWTGVNFPFTANYRINITGDGVALESVIKHRGIVQHSAVTGSVKQDLSYSATLETISTVNASSSPATANLTALGKLLKPLDVPSITGFEAGQFVSLSWGASADVDLIGYRIKRGATTDTWSTAPITVVSRVDATTYLEQSVPAGTHRYFIKALDSLDQESANAVFTDIDVTADEAAAVTENSATLAAATLTNMHSYEISGDARYAVTSYGQIWSQRFGTAGSTWGANGTKPWCLGHPDSAAAYLETGEWDIGIDRTGNWAFDATVSLIQSGTGAAQKTDSVLLSTAANYPTFTTYAGRSTVKPGRYMKSKIEDSGNNGDAAIKVRFPFIQSLKGKIITQRGQASIPASGQPLTVIFTEAYAANPDISLTLVGSTPRTIAKDAVTPSQFDLYAWDSAGAAAAATVDWVATGS